MTANVRKPYEVVPTTILGVIIGTHVINRADEQDESEQPLGGYFGFIPNERFLVMLPTEWVDTFNWVERNLRYRDEWCFSVNNESGGVEFIVDSEDYNEDDFCNSSMRSESLDWKRIFEI